MSNSTTTVVDHAATYAARAHDLTNCHDTRHTGLDCPACHGVKIACRTHQTPSTGSAKTGDVASPVATEGRTPGREVEPTPQAPSRPGVTPEDRVTTSAPFTVDRTITADDIHLVTVALTDDTAHAHVRDLADLHIRDLILLSRLRQQERKHRQHGLDGSATTARREARRVEDRLVGSLTAHMTTQWELTLTQAEQLLADLEDAATEPETCLVGTCTGYAATSGYCAGHADGI